MSSPPQRESVSYNRASIESVSSVTHLFNPKHNRDTLPPLNYSLADRKLAVFVCWLVIFVDSCASAIALYYPLTYATSLVPWQVMTIVTCLVGIITLVQFFWRAWVLIGQNDRRRPIGGNRWQLDCFQWIYTIGMVIVVVELVIGTIPDDPIIPLCSMPLATTLFLAAGCELLPTIGYFFNLRTPFRISSVARGAPCRPGVYTILEDIVAVDGNGGREYREALNKRYEASPEFRNMLAKLSLFWSIPALLIGGVTTAVVWTTSDPISFGIGWTLPFVWITIWGLITIPIVKHMLNKERQVWTRSVLDG